MNKKAMKIYDELLKMSKDEKDANVDSTVNKLFSIDMNYEEAKKQLSKMREETSVC